MPNKPEPIKSDVQLVSSALAAPQGSCLPADEATNMREHMW